MTELQTVPEATLLRSNYRALQTAKALKRVEKAWSSIVPGNIKDTYAVAQLDIIDTIVEFQRKVVRGVEPYIINVMNEQGIDAQPPEIHTKQLVGVASDGRSLATLVDQSEAVVYEQIRKGASRVTALKDGLTWMSLVTTTLLSDAGRSADGIGIASTKQVTGYYRQLNGKSCSRCVVLAGRFYKNNKGFKRHPKCDCRNVPAGEFDPQFALSPEEYFSALTPKERQETFGIAGARAIEDGADIARVVNADRGMYTTSRAKFTKEIADFSPNGVRLMPETIYDLYPDPKDAVRALKRHGYIS